MYNNIKIYRNVIYDLCDQGHATKVSWVSKNQRCAALQADETLKRFSAEILA